MCELIGSCPLKLPYFYFFFEQNFFFIMILLRTSLQQNKVTYITNTTYKLITKISLTQAKLKKDNTTNYYCY